MCKRVTWPPNSGRILTPTVTDSDMVAFFARARAGGFGFVLRCVESGLVTGLAGLIDGGTEARRRGYEYVADVNVARTGWLRLCDCRWWVDGLMDGWKCVCGWVLDMRQED